MDSLHSGQYLTFTLGEDSFAIPIEHVLEVLEVEKITRIPRTQDFLLGVINVRGSIRPIVDLRAKLNLPPRVLQEEEMYNIIIMELVIDNENTVLGIVTDMVDQVVTLRAEDIDPTPRIGTRLNSLLIKGIGKIKDLFLIILDTDYLFSTRATNLRMKGLPEPAVP